MTREEAISELKQFSGVTRLKLSANFWNALDMAIKALKQHPNTWSLDDAREDFVYDVYNTLDFLSTNEEANRIIDSFDRVTSGLKQESCDDCISRAEVLSIYDEWFATCDIADNKTSPKAKIKALPPVQPKPKTGHWIKCDCWSEGAGMGEIYGYYYQCSECQKKVKDGYAKCDSKYCSNCGARMIEP